jgi:hypothetical protein
VIGYLYSAANPDRAHVHFTLYENAVPICPAPFFTQTAHESILNLVAVVHQDVVMCRSGNVMPPPLVTPYINESDMAKITAGYSSTYSLSPWGYPHDGLDIYPKSDLKPLQAACSGKIDAVELQQDSMNGNWQVEVAVACDEYVMDPEFGGYFIPLTSKYYFQTISSDPSVGQSTVFIVGTEFCFKSPADSLARCGVVLSIVKNRGQFPANARGASRGLW